jgi:trehalose synthase
MPRIEDYEPLVGPETVGRILKKAKALEGFHVANINSTYYGGGAAEFESSFRHIGCCARSTWSVEQRNIFSRE